MLKVLVFEDHADEVQILSEYTKLFLKQDIFLMIWILEVLFRMTWISYLDIELGAQEKMQNQRFFH